MKQKFFALLASLLFFASNVHGEPLCEVCIDYKGYPAPLDMVSWPSDLDGRAESAVSSPDDDVFCEVLKVSLEPENLSEFDDNRTASYL